MERNKGDDMEATNKVKVPHSHDELRNQSSADDKKVPQLKNYSLNNEIHKKEIFLCIFEVRNLLGITDRAIRKNCKNNKYQYYIDKSPNKKGGETYYISLSSLPVEAQEKYWESLVKLNMEEAKRKGWGNEIAERVIRNYEIKSQVSDKIVSEQVKSASPEVKKVAFRAINDKKVAEKKKIIEEAMDVPSGWKVKKWQMMVAHKYGVHYATLRRWIERVERAGVMGLVHKSTGKDRMITWSEEGLNALRGFFLKRENRKMSKKQIYVFLKADAEKKGYKIGSYSSALAYLRELEQEESKLIEYRDKGTRGLDNAISPIRRCYGDLEPFQIVVGDQHRFDFWVVDEYSGKIFRPECYLWQDLNSRAIYGISIGKKYDSEMMGEALYMGIKIFGAPLQVYTDNGGPETSKYFLDKKTEFDLVGIDVHDTSEINNYLAIKEEFTGVYADLGIERRLAKVRNAKAKMIEGTFSKIENLLVDMGVAGYVHELGGNKEAVEIDDNELKRLAKDGKLLTFEEFCRVVLQVCNIYNKDKHHRGLAEQVRREKASVYFNEKVTPYAYIYYKMQKGWQPRRISDEALELIFLRRAIRKVNKGTIMLEGEYYTSDKLNDLADKTTVEVRYRNDKSYIIVLYKGEYFCDAYRLEYSSMNDDELAKAKIRQKNEIKRKYVEAYKEYTKPIEDNRIYSAKGIKVEELAQKRKELTQKAAIEKAYRERVMTAEEVKAEEEKLAKLEADLEMKKQLNRVKELPKRPFVFLSAFEKYDWLCKYRDAGGELTEEDKGFIDKYEIEKGLRI